ncbi:MAG: response regulator transcription factor [Muribaculaceae bacterium]|nr:response regulator transcription factor [Muribaculaceae bacterium]
MDKLSFLIAESSPIVAAGLSYCLRRLPGVQATASEVATLDDLRQSMATMTPSVVVVNPAFGGVFDPDKFRNEFPGDYKLIAIDLHHLQPTTRVLYDQTISIIDDIPTMASKVSDIFSHVPDELTSDEEQLSKREKEIVALVVKGMTNKEISEKLFISIHTVTTHRRNIARKLQIHSATGLTIYAIVNHLVDITDLNL